LPPHKPVLLREVIKFFKTDEFGYFIDATIGYGGHSEEILKNSPNIHLIGIDRDEVAINYSKERLKEFKNRISFYHGSFGENIKQILEKYQDKNILGVLADIGVSSLQLDSLDRGFSFESENLDMRMDKNQNLTAYDVVNSYSEYSLGLILKEFGEVRNYKKIANKIVNNRPINSGKELAELIKKLGVRGKINPATQTFQAIRIEVNRELEELENLLKSLGNLTDSKVGIISFHSLEDKIVKNYFRKWAKPCICPNGVFRCECGNNNQKGKILTKKPIIAQPDEVRENPRSRSAKLRVFQFILQNK
jgi:16S rRNA (cytosine1402-N4)-methyltransferase